MITSTQHLLWKNLMGEKELISIKMSNADKAFSLKIKRVFSNLVFLENK